MSAQAIEAALGSSLIVIPSVNGGRLLKRMLPTLRVPSHLVVVIDQASEDDTAQICAQAGVELHQVGQRLTYTQACNLGAELARARGCEYLFVANNDIAFTTDVCRELLAEMLHDERLGIVAPAQIIVDEAKGERHVAYRVHWQLERMVFHHDFIPPPRDTHRLEADFCELTFALVRMSVFDEIGFLDDEYGFYHEDADFGFRLGMAGYASAYLPMSQIEHYASSTFSGEKSPLKLSYLRKNRRLFAALHLGYGVDHRVDDPATPVALRGANQTLHSYLRRYGLLDAQRPKLTFGGMGSVNSGYLIASRSRSRPPRSWRSWAGGCEALFAASSWAVEALSKNGFAEARTAAVGVETDVFNPWGLAERFDTAPTLAWMQVDPHDQGLAAMLVAWDKARAADKHARLLLIGEGTLAAIPAHDSTERRWRNLTIRESADRRIVAVVPDAPLDEEERARLLRSVDFTIWTARGGLALAGVAESLACGTPALTPDHAEFEDLRVPGSVGIAGLTTSYLDDAEPFSDWTPDIEALTDALGRTLHLCKQDYRNLSEAGILRVRQRGTWRHAIYALRQALAAKQSPKAGSIAQEDLDVVRAAEATVPRRSHVWCIHQLRRMAALFSLFADDWEARGGAYAARAAALRLRVFSARLKLARFFGRNRAVTASAPAPRGAEIVSKPGVMFLGYVEAGLGLGESLRGMVRAYSTGTRPFGVYPFREGVETRLIGPFMPQTYDLGGRYDVAVIEVTVDEIPTVFKTVDRRLFAGTRIALRTYWELPSAPAAWKPMLKGIDEIWAPNNFVAEAFREIFDGEIFIVPPCIEPETENLPGRAHYGLNDDRFYFLFTFDYFSFPSRKNPLAVLEAFRQAFPDQSDPLVGLVLKSTGADDHHPDLKRTFQLAAQADSRIVILDETMSRRDVHGLIAACDCYVSLHRSEGFGFGMAEAMYYGRPVIATGYSGNADYLTEKTGFPVSYHLRPVSADEYVWTEGQVWAEPSLASAVEAFRTVYDKPDLRHLRAQAGAAFVRHAYSARAVRSAIEGRIDLK